MELNLTIWKDRLDWETDEVIEEEAEVVVVVSHQEADPSVGVSEDLAITSAHWASDGEEVSLDASDKRGIEREASLLGVNHV